MEKSLLPASWQRLSDNPFGGNKFIDMKPGFLIGSDPHNLSWLGNGVDEPFKHAIPQSSSSTPWSKSEEPGSWLPSILTGLWPTFKSSGAAGASAQASSSDSSSRTSSRAAELSTELCTEWPVPYGNFKIDQRASLDLEGPHYLGPTLAFTSTHNLFNLTANKKGLETTGHFPKMPKEYSYSLGVDVRETHAEHNHSPGETRSDCPLCLLARNNRVMDQYGLDVAVGLQKRGDRGRVEAKLIFDLDGKEQTRVRLAGEREFNSNLQFGADAEFDGKGQHLLGANASYNVGRPGRVGARIQVTNAKTSSASKFAVWWTKTLWRS
ncbi:uncharacterized protein Z520_06194 [Fonsecaea multimorphosa CBS 102226]|uniref:Uncharacterized protein n=1 Tax=Fonsecaea multimorphosa CBS 102226 TaxID=1442371 RepID=A0A0D2K4L6_9EURO|nr:uncharacterized protein Z520_06194 [Fonsecaea multimorphosa CBS 102226]KIX98114.1 hypothetical protein Z520_06194 [Fonsecaea multimorphosa CBS 102226]OAL24190.1 hypothetical protein AYO22_05850 [Fonsecaea multimorphosa]